MNQTPDHPTAEPNAHGRARRRLLLTLAGTGGAFAAANLLPRRWTRPIIDTVFVPAHAQASGPVIGLFTTTSQAGSLFDFIVAPVHAIPLGDVNVGNASFSVAWDLGTEGYSYCATGFFLTGNGTAISFFTNGAGDRKANSLSDIDISASSETSGQVSGNLLITNQLVSDSQLSFDASFQSATTSGTAVAGGACLVNSVNNLHMSSPYADKDLA